MVVWLQRGDEAVATECNDSQGQECNPTMLAYALPDQPGSTNLSDGSKQEKHKRARDSHAPIMPQTDTPAS